RFCLLALHRKVIGHTSPAPARHLVAEESACAGIERFRVEMMAASQQLLDLGADRGHRSRFLRGSGDVLDIADAQHLLEGRPWNEGHVRLLLVFDRSNDAEDSEAAVVDLDVLADRIDSSSKELVAQRWPDHCDLTRGLDIRLPEEPAARDIPAVRVEVRRVDSISLGELATGSVTDPTTVLHQVADKADARNGADCIGIGWNERVRGAQPGGDVQLLTTASVV